MQTTMDEYQAQPGAVDQEVRAYVYSLVSALGGTGIDEDGRYVLGDDALAVLKDIKRWLKLYDEKLSRLDVARCLAEANAVKGDILEILSAWPEDEAPGKLMGKMALACLEVLVPLTWPLERDSAQITTSQYTHMPYLQLAQIGYKREILEHPTTAVLRTAIRVALPSISLPLAERSQRDEGIIKLVLYFLRNIAMITASPNLAVEWNENEVSRSATIEAFHNQDVFALLLTISSNIGEDFNTQDVVVLEVLFHILKGVNVEKLFLEDEELDKKNSKELKSLVDKEAAMLRGYAKNAPTRHNRFGTMIWVKRDDEKLSTVSGQDVLKGGQHTLAKMDQSKKWNKPRHRKKEQRTNNHFDLPTPLTKNAKTYLKSFVEDFLDAGFNPLFSYLRRAIERDAERVLESHQQQFLYLIGWFLQAERARKAAKKRQQTKRGVPATNLETDSYGLVASVLNQETFILLNKQMQDWLDHKQWLELDAGMRCFTQILLTVQEMAESPIDEDQEIADNIQNRIFYEETTHDRVLTILRGYKDQNFSYLDACTDLAHVFLRLLERYSKENIDLQVRSRRRARKKKAKQATDAPDEPEDSEAEDEADAQRISRERKFDFTRFAAKFVTQPCVNTFATFTTYYRDLNNEQLKRAHRYFYRVAFKQEMSVMLFRLDIIALFHRMIKGPEGLNTADPMFGEWQELAKQVFRRFIKKMQQRPGLAIEVLFSKVNSIAFYLEHGYEKEAVVSTARAPADLEVKGEMSIAVQIAVVVAALSEHDLDHVVFTENAVLAAASERKAWESAQQAQRIVTGEDGATPKIDQAAPPKIALKPDNEARRIAIFKNGKFRLLLTSSGLERPSDSDDSHAQWSFPANLASDDLEKTAEIIASNRREPRENWGTEEEPIMAEAMLQRNYAPREKNNVFDSDGEEDFVNDAEMDALVEQARALPKNNATTRKALNKLKTFRKRKSTDDEDDSTSEPDDEAIRNRRKARLLADIAKRSKIKSSEFIHDSDDEDNEERDREFFENEEAHRKGQAKKIMEMLRTEQAQRAKDKDDKKKSKKRRKLDEAEKENATPVASEHEDELDLLLGPASSSDKGRHSAMVSDEGDEETPLSSQSESAVKKASKPIAPFAEESEDDDLDIIMKDVATVKPTSTSNDVPKTAVIVDEDSDLDIAPQTSGRQRRQLISLDDSDDE